LLSPPFPPFLLAPSDVAPCEMWCEGARCPLFFLFQTRLPSQTLNLFFSNLFLSLSPPAFIRNGNLRVPTVGCLPFCFSRTPPRGFFCVLVTLSFSFCRFCSLFLVFDSVLPLPLHLRSANEIGLRFACHFQLLTSRLM